jgi:DNA-binding response OmpR family regulator
VDANSEAANQLAVQLSHSGFPTDVATSCWVALGAVRTKRYGALVVAADLGLAGDRGCLTHLRETARNAWIVVICSRPHPDARQNVFECGADSVLTVPFSLQDLTSRLSALSLRSRPP